MKKRPLLLLSAVLFLLAIFVRARIINALNLDMILLQRWYSFILEHGESGLADPTFSNYPPAYLYLLWFSTLLSAWLEPVTALKLLPTLFDFVSMFFIFLLARMRFKDDEPYFLAGLFFLMPTIVLNSTAWGQIDSMFTPFFWHLHTSCSKKNLFGRCLHLALHFLSRHRQSSFFRFSD